jgi:zinc transporter ZupT
VERRQIDRLVTLLHLLLLVTMFQVLCYHAFIIEGMAVSIPLYYATRDKFKTLQLTLINGLFEPASVLICSIFIWLLSSDVNGEDIVINDSLNAKLLAGVCGVMAFVSLHELYPSSIHYCSSSQLGSSGLTTGKNQAWFFMIIGMVIGYIVILLPI